MTGYTESLRHIKLKIRSLLPKAVPEGSLHLAEEGWAYFAFKTFVYCERSSCKNSVKVEFDPVCLRRLR